jgi:hypothetical protein
VKFKFLLRRFDCILKSNFAVGWKRSGWGLCKIESDTQGYECLSNVHWLNYRYAKIIRKTYEKPRCQASLCIFGLVNLLCVFILWLWLEHNQSLWTLLAEQQMLGIWTYLQIYLRDIGQSTLTTFPAKSNSPPQLGRGDLHWLMHCVNILISKYKHIWNFI